MDLGIGNCRNLYGGKNGPRLFPTQMVSVNVIEKSPSGVVFAVLGNDLVEPEVSQDQS